MTWIHIPSTTCPAIPAQVVNFSPVNGSSGGLPSATLNEKNTPPTLSRQESETGTCAMLPSGATCTPSPNGTTNCADSFVNYSLFVASWLSRVVSRASRSVVQAGVTATPTNEMDGRIPFVSLENYVPPSSSLKTWTTSCGRWIKPQMSLWGTSEPYSATWPKAGMVSDGVCYRLPKWEQRIREIGSGLLLPTPTANKHTSNAADPDNLVDSHGKPWEPGKKPFDKRSGRQVTTTPHDFVRHFQMWPTPTINGNHNRKGISAKSGDGLATAVRMWPTPNVPNGGRQANTDRLNIVGNCAYREDGTKAQIGLEVAVKLWRTPNARDGEKGWNSHNSNGSLHLSAQVHQYPTPSATDYRTGYREDSEAGIAQREKRSKPLRPAAAPGTQLNPDWVEWLMGWPIGWTSLEPLPQGMFLEWLDKSSAGTWWQSDPAEPSDDWDVVIPRTGKGIKDRTSRLRGIGNGQVPVCAYTAFFILMGGYDA